MKNNIFLLFIAVILVSCNSDPSSKWAGKWNYSSYSAKDIRVLYAYFNIKKSGEIDEYLMPLIGVDYLMVNDGKATNLSGLDYVSGNFTADDKYISINGEKIYEIIEYKRSTVKLKPLKLQFNLDKNPENDITLTFERDKLYKIDSLDYTAPKYNKWRKLAVDKEDSQVIINRLAQQVEYARVYFEKESKLRNQVKTIGVELPFQFYGNGIALEKYNPTQKWINYYYDFDDQQIAYDYLVQAFKETVRKDFKSKDILDYDRQVLKSIEDYLKSVKVVTTE